mmetsp:Transcript_9100/g.16804  ORF Transcript_9100/g.16804 Transcript_9100/m.16804 type:complete len:89 (+) Transcript_9100:214-480(+)
MQRQASCALVALNAAFTLKNTILEVTMAALMKTARGRSGASQVQARCRGARPRLSNVLGESDQGCEPASKLGDSAAICVVDAKDEETK